MHTILLLIEHETPTEQYIKHVKRLCHLLDSARFDQLTNVAYFGFHKRNGTIIKQILKESCVLRKHYAYFNFYLGFNTDIVADCQNKGYTVPKLPKLDD